MERMRFEPHALGRPYHAALVDLQTESSPHGHLDYYEVMAVVAGEGEHRLHHADGSMSSLPLHEGVVTLVRPKDQHSMVGPVQFFNVAFPAPGWRSFVQLAQAETNIDRPDVPIHSQDAEGVASRVCAALVDRFHVRPRQLDLMELWAAILPLFDQPHDAPDLAAPGWLTTAIAAMHKESNLQAGVPRFVALSHVSAEHLSRSVRRYLDSTPSAIVSDLRLRHAAALLARTQRPILAIAHASGFSSASYFGAQFRAAHAMSPREFRDRARTTFVP